MISKLHDDGTLAPMDVLFKINEIIDYVNDMEAKV